MKKREFNSEQIQFVRHLVESGIPQRKIAEEYTERFHEKIGQTEVRRLMAKNGINSFRQEKTSAPIGYEYYSSHYRCVLVKVSMDRKAFKNGFRFKQSVVWETYTGKKIPHGYGVAFLDGNRMNYNPENLFCCPLNVIGNVEKWNMHSENPEIYKAALMYGELYFSMMKNAPATMDKLKRAGAV